MILYALDKNYETYSILSSNNVQWNRKYYDVGDFSVQIPAKDYSNEMCFIYMQGRTELGLIEKVLYTNDRSGEHVQLIGFFSEFELNDKIVYPTFYAKGNIENEIYRMINTYKEDIPKLETTTIPNLVGSDVDFQETGGELSRVIYPRLQTQELSFRVKYDFVSAKKIAEVWQGKDRTQSQSENNFVVFSTKFGNLNEPVVEEDKSNFKNYAQVGGSGEGKDRIYVTIDLSNGGYKKKIFIDGKSEAYDPEKQTLQEYKDSLYQYGLKKMLDYQVIQNVDFKSEESGYIYMEDFDLGDKCDVIIEPLQLSLEARIIAVYEVFKDNTHTIELEFGNKRLTDYQKARLD